MRIELLSFNSFDVFIKDFARKLFEEGSFNLATSGLWGQHTSDAPCCSTVLPQSNIFSKTKGNPGHGEELIPNQTQCPNQILAKTLEIFIQLR